MSLVDQQIISLNVGLPAKEFIAVSSVQGEFKGELINIRKFLISAT